MLELKNINKAYERQLISNFSYTFGKGIYQITGANGSGKTTLLNIICKNTSYDGEIKLNNIDYQDITREQLLAEYITYVRQDDDLFEQLSIKENIDILTNNYNKSYMLKLLNFFELNEQYTTKVKNLSGGERIKLKIIIGLVFKRSILILDEPENHLDDASIKKLHQIIHSYEGTVIIVSHNDVQNSDVIKVSLTDDNEIIESSYTNKKITYKRKINAYTDLLRSKLRIIFLLVTIIYLLLQIGIAVDTKITQVMYNTTQIEYFTDDTIILVQPPIENSYGTQFKDESWFEKTPFLLTEEQFNKLENDERVSSIEGLEVELGLSSFYLEYNDKQYYSTDYELSNSTYEKSISEKIGTDLINPNDISGFIPEDDSNQILISKQTANLFNVQIGDTIDFELSNVEDENDKITKTYLISGIADSYYDDNYIAHNTKSNSSIIQAINDSDEYYQTTIDYFKSNSPYKYYDQYKDKDQDYYFGFVIKTQSEEDAKTLLKDLYEHDKYLEIKSNFNYEFGILAQLKDEYLLRRVILSVEFSLLYIVIIIILYLISLRRLVNNIIKSLIKHGFSQSDYLQLLKLNFKIYYKYLCISYTYILSYILLFHTLTSTIILISTALIILILIYFCNKLLIKIILKHLEKEEYATNN